MLVPPTPVHSDFHIYLGNEWQKNFENATLLAKRLGINVDLDRVKPPIAPIGGIYWYKTKALQSLFDKGFAYQDFPIEPINDTDGTILRVIECLYPFIAQQNGFYSGWVMSDVYTKMELTNLYKILGDFNRVFIRKFGVNSRYTNMEIISKSQNPLIVQQIRGRKRIKSIIRKIFGRRGFQLIKGIWNRVKPDGDRRT
jgi:rhamnosyltransferase